MFIIVLGQHVSILIESSSGPSKKTDPYLKCLKIYCEIPNAYICKRLGSHSAFLNILSKAELCHPLCVFKLYGEVNSVKSTTINIWLNDGVY